MGQSLESIGQSILSISETGYCEVSEDCLHMNCTYRKTFDISGVMVVQEMHLFPCAKPPAVYIKVSVPTLGTFIDDVFNESKNITLISNGVPVEARIGIEQRPQRIAANVGKRTHIQYMHAALVHKPKAQLSSFTHRHTTPHTVLM